MNHDASSGNGFQNYKMIHVPVHYSRQLQPPEIGHFEAQRSAREVHLARHLDEGPECDPLQRYRVLTAKSIKINAVPVIGANHGQAGQPAFGRFRLTDHGEMATASKIQQGGHDYILTLSSGSRSQLISERFSSMMSARRSMPA